MTDLLNSISDELTTEYFAGLEKYLEGASLPLHLDEFMKLESRFYSDWLRDRRRSTRKAAYRDLTISA